MLKCNNNGKNKVIVIIIKRFVIITIFGNSN